MFPSTFLHHFGEPVSSAFHPNTLVAGIDNPMIAPRVCGNRWRVAVKIETGLCCPS